MHVSTITQKPGACVRMEPDLEDIAGHLKPHQRRILAAKFARWAHQLQVTAGVIEKRQQPKAPPQQLPYVHPSKLGGN